MYFENVKGQSLQKYMINQSKMENQSCIYV